MNAIAPDVLAILKASTVEQGNQIRLPNIPLGHKLHQRVNKMLENLGGHWSSQLRVHTFENDISEEFALVCEEGRYERKLDELRAVYNSFETPLRVVSRLLELAELRPQETVLEPSAGRGAIARAVGNLGHAVYCVEMHPENVDGLNLEGFHVREGDFLSMTPSYQCDVVIANPPFSGSRDARHILHMIGFAKRRVVSVCSPGVKFRGGVYRELFDTINNSGGDIFDLPGGSFKESGTRVNSCVVVIDI